MIFTGSSDASFGLKISLSGVEKDHDSETRVNNRGSSHLQTPVFGHFLYLTIDELLIEGTFLWKFTLICPKFW